MPNHEDVEKAIDEEAVYHVSVERGVMDGEIEIRFLDGPLAHERYTAMGMQGY